jgi:hypothetical protein
MLDIYSICRCCWNVAAYKWKVHNGKIEIISLAVKFSVTEIKLFAVISSFMNYHMVLTKVSLVEQELLPFQTT